MPGKDEARGGYHDPPAPDLRPTRGNPEIAARGSDLQALSWLPEIGYENDNGRDKPLSFHWRAKPDVFEALFGSSGNRALNSVRNSILTEGVLAFESGGRWVSYARRRGFYVDRYCGTPISYETITRTLEWALADGLVEEERAAPGRSPPHPPSVAFSCHAVPRRGISRGGASS